MNIPHSNKSTVNEPAMIPEFLIKEGLILTLSVKLRRIEPYSSSEKRDQPPVTGLRPSRDV